MNLSYCPAYKNKGWECLSSKEKSVFLLFCIAAHRANIKEQTDGLILIQGTPEIYDLSKEEISRMVRIYSRMGLTSHKPTKFGYVMQITNWYRYEQTDIQDKRF